MKKIYVLGFMLSLLFGGAGPAFGQSEPSASALPAVYISEVNWAGSAHSLADEWLEITNGSSETVDLGGWIVDGAAASGGALQIAAGVAVAPQSTLLIANYNIGDEKTTLAIAPTVVTSSVSLANSNLTLRLIDPAGAVHDILAFGSSPSAGSSNPFASAIRQANGTTITASLSQNLLETNQFGTPGNIDTATAVVEEPVLEETPMEESPIEIVEPVAAEPPEETPIDCCGCACNEESTSTPVEEETLFVDTPNDTSEEPEAPATTEEQEVAEETVVQEEAQTTTASENVATGNQQDLIISEFVSDPVDGAEWIELFNPSAHRVDVTGMYIADAAGGKTLLAGVIEANAYSVIENPKGKLNNDADAVLLHAANGTEVMQASYGTSELKAGKKGESVGQIDGIWQVLATPTKGYANQPNPVPAAIIEEAAEEQEEAVVTATETEQAEGTATATPSAEDALEAPKQDASVVTIVSIAEKPSAEKKSATDKKSGSTKKSATEEVSITGVITVEPGVLGKQIAYLEGYQLYFNKAEWPELKTGDLISATGTISMLNNERRFKISSANAINVKSHAGITPHTLEASRLNSEYIGYTFTFDVNIEERGKRDLKTNLEGSTLRIRLPKDMNGNLVPEDTLRGKGVLRSNKDGFYLEVLTKEDLVFAQTGITGIDRTEYPNKHKSSNSKSMAGAGLFTGTLGALGYWLRKSLILS